MKKITDWAKKKAATVSIALSNVEKNALTQTHEGLATDVTQSTRMNQGKISDALINGEITQEVMDLRWRMYKVLEADDNLIIKLNGYDDNDNPIYEVKGREFKIEKPIIDSVDSYPLQMVVDNTEIKSSQADTLATLTGDSVDGLDYYTKSKNEKPIKVIRENIPNFYLENYAKMLKVRKIDESKSMLEFHISIYPDEDDRTTRFLISSLKKQMENPQFGAAMFELKEINYVTEKTLGVSNNLLYEYNNIVFDKIVIFNGHYVVKFIGDIKTNGEYIMQKYVQEALELRYQTKEKK